MRPRERWAPAPQIHALLPGLWLIDPAAGGVLAVPPEWIEVAAHLVTTPVAATVLIALGLIGLIFEIKAGAFGAGVLVSLISLGLFFGGAFLLGLAGWQEVLLLAVGLVALMVEGFVLPGFGVAGMLGIGLIAGAVVLALVGGGATSGDVFNAFAVLGTAVVITGAVFAAWIRHLPNSTRWRGLLLTDAVHREEGYLSAPTREDLVGGQGVALTDLRPAGVAEVAGERLDVVSEGEFIAAGAPVTVVRSDGYRHVVRVVRAISLEQPI